MPNNPQILNKPSRYTGMLLLCLAATFLAGGAAESANSVYTSHVEAELVPEVLGIQPGKAFTAALRMKMDPGWHTYWRNPGDSGLATTIEWKLPAGFTASEFRWPYPERIDIPDVITFGYEGEILLLADIVPPANLEKGGPVLIGGEVSWLVCKEICIPGRAKLALSLPVASEPRLNGPWVPKFAEARSMLPTENPDWEIRGERSGGDVELYLKPPAWFRSKLTVREFFPVRPGVLDYLKPQVFRKTGDTYRLRLKLRDDFDGRLDDLEGVWVSEAGWRGPGSEKALRVKIALTDVPHLAPAEAKTLNLGMAILFSFLGGLILNLMPCVLPVLSVKILGFLSQAHGKTVHLRLHGLLYGAGVLLSFWVLGGLVSVLKAGGQEIGWGFQLQSPVFVTVIAALFFVIGLNLLGVFEAGLFLTTMGAKAKTAASWQGAVLSGVLATIVATPCTAPFMGAALGYALSGTHGTSWVIFTFLGLGMAFPYVVLSFFPDLVRNLPKPGPWMVHLKRFMALPMMATVLWLAWVLSVQAGTPAVWGLAAGLAVMGIGVWVYGRGHTLVGILIVCVGLGGALWNVRFQPARPRSDVIRIENGLAWERYSPAALDAYRKAEKPVFLDFTAAWCLTCQVNERLVFSSQKVKDRLRELGVVLVKGDWTNRDPEITRAIQSFGRNGVPLNVLYGRDPSKPPVILPEVLTPGIVLEALDNLS